MTVRRLVCKSFSTLADQVLFLFVIMLVSIERTVKERQFNQSSGWWDRCRRRAGGLSSRSIRREGNLPAHAMSNVGIAEQRRWSVHCSTGKYVRLRDRLLFAAGGDHRTVIMAKKRI